MTGPIVAGAALISALIRPPSEIPPMYQHSADVSNTFLSNLVADCAPSGLACRPVDLVACWLHESGLSARAQNPDALAAGFFQAMPATLRGMGFSGDARYREPRGAYAAALAASKGPHPPGGSEAANARAAMRALDKALSDAFCRLTLEEQLVWAYRYYRGHAGKLPNAGACYAANFVPGLLAHAGDARFVICAADGRASWDMGKGSAEANAKESALWFRENHTLDADGDGAITMGDLGTIAAHAIATPRGRELAERLDALGGDLAPATQPEPPVADDVTDGGNDRPVFAVPPLEDEPV